MPKDDGLPREPNRTVYAAAGGSTNAVASGSNSTGSSKRKVAAAAAEAKVLKRNQVGAPFAARVWLLASLI